MSDDSAAWFVCAACGDPVGVYEPCVVEVNGEPIETSWLSLTVDQRVEARASGVYHGVCHARRTGDNCKG